MFELRKYQSAAVDAVINDMKRDGNSLVILPTGAGKSIVIAEVANRINKPVLILQPSKEILEQNIGKLRRYVPKHDTGIYSASFGLKQIRKFTFATIQSVYKKAELFTGFGLILFDEAHSYDPKNLDGMFATFLNGLDKPKVFGFTASPFRNYTRQHYEKNRAGETLMVAETRVKLINRIEPKFWNKIIFNINAAELIDKGYLCGLTYYDLSFYRREELDLNKTGSEYDLDKFVAKLKHHEQKVIEYVARCARHYKSVLVFCSTVEQANLLASGMPNAECVDGNTKDKIREDIIERFKAGKLKVVFNVGVLCLDAETEILTKRGFVGMNEFSLENDEAANFDNGRIWFSKARGYIQRDRMENEKMVYLETKNRSIRVTEHHKMLWKKSTKSPGYYKILASELVGKMGYLPVSGKAEPVNWNLLPPVQKTPTKKRISKNAYALRQKGMSYDEAKQEATKRIEQHNSLTYLQPNTLSLDWCKFIGFWLGDGSTWQNKNGGTRFNLCQSKTYPAIVEWVKDLLSKLDVDVSCYEKANHWIWTLPRGTGFGQQQTNGLFKVEPYLKKDGTNLFQCFDNEQFDALLLGLWYADGDHGKGETVPKNFRCTNTNYQMLSLLQFIAVCRGYKASLKPVKRTNRKENHKQLYRLSVVKRATHFLTKHTLQFEQDWKTEKVWCITTESGNIITRRKGTVTIMGNTTGFDHPELDCIMLLRPTRSLSLYYQMLGRGVRIADGKTSCAVVDFTKTYKALGRIETIELVKEKTTLFQTYPAWEIKTECGSWNDFLVSTFKRKLKKKGKK
jgi:DNA repair protein RadD